MSGKRSRNKGANGEREVVNFCKERGVPARRMAQNQTQREADEPDVQIWQGFYPEVKRRERIEIVKWCEEAEAGAGARTPLVIWRKNNDPWRVTLPFEAFIELMANGR